MPQGNKYFCALYVDILRGKCDSFYLLFFFSPTATNINSEILYYLVRVYWFQLTFLTLLILRAGREKGSIAK